MEIFYANPGTITIACRRGSSLHSFAGYPQLELPDLHSPSFRNKLCCGLGLGSGTRQEAPEVSDIWPMWLEGFCPSPLLPGERACLGLRKVHTNPKSFVWGRSSHVAQTGTRTRRTSLFTRDHHLAVYMQALLLSRRTKAAGQTAPK